MVMPPVPRPFYIHYKIFDIDSNKPCKTRYPIYPTDPFIGRLDASLMPPPRTVLALVERICKREERGFGIDWDNDDAFSTELFKNVSSLTSYNLHSDPFPLSDNCPGSSPLEPLILKVGYKELQELLGLW